MPGRGWLGSALGGALIIGVAGSAGAQDAPAPRAQGYAQVAQWPDWTGVWSPDWSILFPDGGRQPQRPSLTPAAQEQADAIRQRQEVEGIPQEAQAACRPPGMPGLMRQPYPIEFVYSPDRVTILVEAYEQTRRIYLDGRALPEDPDPLFNGTSVGHWEGDTLVIETVGLNPLSTAFEGLSITPDTRIRERYWLKEPGLLLVETTITDPNLLTEPFTEMMAFRVEPGWEMREYVCAENNRLTNEEGGANIDLGFGDEDPFGPLP